MPARQGRLYPPRKRLKYKKDCPWEVEETPMDPEVYAQLSPSAKAYVDNKPVHPWPSPEKYERQRAKDDRKYAPFTITVFLVLSLLALSNVYDSVANPSPRNGWVDLIVGTLFFGWIIVVIVGSWIGIVKSLMKNNPDKS